MLSRADVERITELMISQLKIEVERSHWTSPNERVVKLKLGDKIISQTSFDVVQKDEYEG